VLVDLASRHIYWRAKHSRGLFVAGIPILGRPMVDCPPISLVRSCDTLGDHRAA
jgi:hypothetical protein